MSLTWIDAELSSLEAAGLLRSLCRLESRPGPTLELSGRKLVNFSSNDYLGLAGDPRLARAAAAAAWRWGAGSGSARLIAGGLGLIEDLEAALAAWMGTEAALVFNSGYHANLGAISALLGPGDAVFSDRLNHASIIDGCRLSRAETYIYKHADAADLSAQLGRAAGARRKLVATETVFSMDGDLAPLPALLAAARAHGAMTLVDEAHALGLLGASGRGGLEAHGLSARDVDAVMGTLGKSLGAAGAFVAGTAKLKSFLVNRARTFVFTTAPAPAACGAALEALRVMADEPWRRARALGHAERLKAALRELGHDPGPAAGAIVPIMLGDPTATMAAGEELLRRGLFVQGIRPPTVPAGTSRLRVNLSAGHQDADLDRLIAALAEILPKA